MHIDWWTVGLQAVNILVLVWLFGKFLFPRVMVIMQERQAKAHALLQEAGDLRAAAEQEKAQAEEIRLATLAERTRILAAAETEASEARRLLLEEARRNADQIRMQAETDRAQAAHEQDALAGRRAASLATEIVAQLLARLPEEAKIDGFLDGLLQSIAQLPEPFDTSKRHRLLVTRPLTQDEAAKLHAALGDGLKIEVDESLLAGVELQSEHLRIANHLRADLDAILKAMNDERART